MIIQIDVTQDHIDNGKRYECNACPVALAFQKHINDDYSFEINDEYIDVVTKFNGYTQAEITVPCTVTAFVRDFDSIKPVKPFSFQIDIPDRFLRKT